MFGKVHSVRNSNMPPGDSVNTPVCPNLGRNKQSDRRPATDTGQFDNQIRSADSFGNIQSTVVMFWKNNGGNVSFQLN